MMKKRLMLLAGLIILVALPAYGDTIEVNALLNKAKKDGRAVMLELGSVGCIPCEKMKPVMEKLRRSYKGRLEVLFVDVRKYRDTAQKFGVFAIPTQVFLDKNGKEFHRHVGFYDFEEIVPVLKKEGL